MLENTKIINYLLVTGCFIAINLSLYVHAQECSSNNDDAGYMGSISVTSSNKPCQMWKSLSDSSAFEFVDSIEDSRNFCRNPKGKFKKEKAYCFTNIQTREWEYCNIPKCSGCSKVHGISYGSIQFINRQLYDDGSYQPGSKIVFKCRPNFAVYDSTSGPLEWNCGNDGKWSSNKLPKCLWRGFIESTPNCWYYSADNFYPNSKPRRLYYDTKNTANGTQCINWTKFVNKFKNKDFPQEGKTNAKNYCRSPGDFEPKCPISKTSLKKCGITQCTGCSGIPYVKYTSYDIDYIPNTLENTMETGSTVNYRCSAGTLIGNSNITCVNGKWEGGLPYCSLKYCSKPPPTPDNSYVSNKRFVYANIEDYAKEYLLFDQSTYKFVCKPNYIFEDESVTELIYQCNSGEWTLLGKNSKCVLESRNIPIPQTYCPLPENIENGYRAKYNLFKAGPNQYYGEFEIACNTGYKMIGNPKVTCMNGSWTTYPKCTLLPSCSFDILYKPAENVKIITSNLLYSADNSGISVGSFVQYECLPNYFPEISQDDLRAICLENGQWSTKIPVRCRKMPPKKEKKGKKDGEGKSKKKDDDRDLDKDNLLVQELENATKELDEVKKRVQHLKDENNWLEEEAQRISEESQEYLNFMSKKANMRQNSIITLTDHNKEEIEKLKIQREQIIKEFEDKKLELQNNLIQKQNMLNKVKAEIEEMSEYKELKQRQLEEIEQLEREIIEVRREQTKIISELRAEFIKEKTEHKKEAENRIAAIVKIANKEARDCLSENTYKIKIENQQLRRELFELIEQTKNINAQKEKLESQKIELLNEIKYAEDLKKIRSTHQQRVIEKLNSLHNNK